MQKNELDRMRTTPASDELRNAVLEVMGDPLQDGATVFDCIANCNRGQLGAVMKAWQANVDAERQKTEAMSRALGRAIQRAGIG